jgi:hypothetical protein
MTSTPAIIDKPAIGHMKREPSLAPRHKCSRRKPPVIKITSTPAAEEATTRTKKRKTSPAPRRQRKERLPAPLRSHRQHPAGHEPEHLLQRYSSPFLKREPSPAPRRPRVRSPAPLHRQYNSSPPPEREPSERSILSNDTTATTEYLQRHRIKSELGSDDFVKAELGSAELGSDELGSDKLGSEDFHVIKSELRSDEPVSNDIKSEIESDELGTDDINDFIAADPSSEIAQHAVKHSTAPPAHPAVKRSIARPAHSTHSTTNQVTRPINRTKSDTKKAAIVFKRKGRFGPKFKAMTSISKLCIAHILTSRLANYQTQNLAWQYLYFLQQYYPGADMILPWADGDFETLDDDQDLADQIEQAFLACGCFPAFSGSTSMAAGRAHTQDSGNTGRIAYLKKRAHSNGLFELGALCECGNIHEDTVPWHAILMCGARQLPDLKAPLNGNYSHLYGRP